MAEGDAREAVRSVFEALAARGLARSERQFSVTWLGKAPNYLSDTRGNVSLGAAVTLYVRLARRGHRDLATRVWSAVVAPSA